MALALAGCQGATTRAPRTLEVLVTNDAETLDPRYVTDSVGMRVSRLIHAGLVRLDPDTLEPVPYVARTLVFLDAHTLDVELRDDVRFHSGRKVTAHDVAATLAAFADATVASRHARVVDAIDGVDELGELHLHVRLKRDHATLLSDLEVPILRADEAYGPPDADGALDGLGPYRVASWKRGAIELRPAEGGALPAPYYGLDVRTVHDENARALRFVGGKADVMIGGMSPALLPALAREEGLRIASRPGANLTYVLFRTDAGPFADRTHRKAFALALDREGLVRDMLDGRAKVAGGLLPPSLWSATAKVPWAANPDQAKVLLGGARVHATFLCSTDRLRIAMARVMAQELAEVGIDVEVRPLELGTMIARLGAGEFDAAMLQIPEVTEPNVLRSFLQSSFIPPAGPNRARVRDAELDALLDAGDRTQDRDERKRLYAQAEDRVLAEAYWVPLWHEDQVVLSSARAKDFSPSAEGRWLGLAALR